MKQQQANLYHLSIETICTIVKAHIPVHSYDFPRHIIVLKDSDHNPIGTIRIPLHIDLNAHLAVSDKLVHTLYISLESGYAAISIMCGQENVYHTTFGAYMTRKKQGFSQIKYLNKKGKSRAGSRVRLASTLEFFEKTNLTLTTLFEEYEIHRIAINCTKTLIPYLYQSKVKCPFDKNDGRLYKIPVHIPQSNFTNLALAIKKLKAPILFYDNSGEGLLDCLLKTEK